MTAPAGSATVERAPSRWLPFGVPDGTVRLYCLPHAGGSASAYRLWCGRLGRVAVCPVQPPGRETRLGDAPYASMADQCADLADAVLAAGPGPYAVYGHSLGAVVGFELVREIRRRGGPDPVHLIVSGSPAPQRTDPDFDTDDDGGDAGADAYAGAGAGAHADAGSDSGSASAPGRPRVSEMDDAQAAEFLRGLGGTPGWMLAEPTVLRMILPPFRADFRIREGYRYRPEPPLDVPITALASTADPRASAAAMAEWREQSSGAFELHQLTGGHFAVLEQPTVTHGYIARALRPWV